MNCIIRNAQMSDYDSVVRILNQGQALHINWRPDIYKPNDALLPKAVFEEIVKGDTFYIAENEGNVTGILELIFRHIELFLSTQWRLTNLTAAWVSDIFSLKK